MMSDEYPLMIIRGLPMILICEIMITINKKIRNVNTIRNTDKVELN
jgi:hypothetical protein